MKGPAFILPISKNCLGVVSGSAARDGPQSSEHLPGPLGLGGGHE